MSEKPCYINIDGASYVNDLIEAKGNLHLFRDISHRIGGILAVYCVGSCFLQENKQKSVLIPIMRAGDAFKRSFLKRIFPVPQLHYIATRRDPATFKTKVLYKTFGENCCEKAEVDEVDRIVILEPMLATGGTIGFVIDEIGKAFSYKKIVIVSAFVSKKAEEAIGNKATIIALSKGHDLNEKGYILVPDPYDQKNVVTFDFGDEYCGTYPRQKGGEV